MYKRRINKFGGSVLKLDIDDLKRIEAEMAEVEEMNKEYGLLQLLEHEDAGDRE